MAVPYLQQIKFCHFLAKVMHAPPKAWREGVLVGTLPAHDLVAVPSMRN